MSVFPSSEMAVKVFSSLFAVLLEDDDFVARARQEGLSVRLVHTKPDCEIFVAPQGLRIGEEQAGPAAITLRMSCDTAHALWMGQLMVPVAIATGRLRIRGKVAKVLELVPMLRPAFDRYPEIAAAAGIAA
ncbi:SCP2 sterol-binding domain-containing protein [Streptomyces hyaluromycini]|uniref:SCP2 sterol-binding domain-containing protein n=1 Tax=Streptomyces hyaluromycini TaxID=1377993 RepID=UPI0011AE471E|nr:SCP2 sterol-binding domain-containing protein [Streptomyces hyaluromycini]